ncbi:MAG: hypothetical protein JRN21_09975 [Nitrososphaerota archaeon]|nr:hypothetical protein [Nitrososphaerota archaeon]
MREIEMETKQHVSVSPTSLFVTEKTMDLIYTAYQGYRTSIGFIDPRTCLAYTVEYIPDNEPAWTICDIRGQNDLIRILAHLSRNGWTLELKGLREDHTWERFGFPKLTYDKRLKMISKMLKSAKAIEAR